MAGVWSRAIWFGRVRRQLRFGITLALVLFAVMFALHTPAIAGVVHPLGIPTGFGRNIGIVVPLVFVTAAVAGYLTNGVLVSLLLAAGLTFGAFLPAALFDYPDFPVPLMPVLRTALLLTVSIGVIGFAIGAGGRQLMERRAGK